MLLKLVMVVLTSQASLIRWIIHAVTEVNQSRRHIRQIIGWIAFLIFELLVWVTDRGCLVMFAAIIQRVFIFYDNSLLNSCSLVHTTLSHKSVQGRNDVLLEKTALAHIINKFLQFVALYNFGTFHD